MIGLCSNSIQKKMTVAVIIVNYNKKDLLEKCLTSLVHTQECEHTVFVVDNGSEDGSIEMMREKFPHVVVIEMGYNAGFCKGNNVGIHEAIDLGCEVIILLNNDTEVDAAFIRAGVREMNTDDKVGMIAPKIIYMHDKSKINATGQIITPDGIAKCRNEMDDVNSVNEKNETFCPFGAAAFYHVDVVRALIDQDGDFFDEDYFMYYEELDIGWRARLRGWTCMYVPQSIVYHHGSATSGGHSELVAFHTNRNSFYTIIKDYPGIYMVRALLLAFIRYPVLAWGMVCGIGPAHKIKQKTSFLSLVAIVLRGYGDVVHNVGVLWRKRKRIQKSRVVDRKEISRWFRDLGVSFFNSVYK